MSKARGWNADFQKYSIFQQVTIYRIHGGREGGREGDGETQMHHRKNSRLASNYELKRRHVLAVQEVLVKSDHQVLPLCHHRQRSLQMMNLPLRKYLMWR